MKTLLGLTALGLLAACAGTPPSTTPVRDLEVRGQSTGSWSDGTPGGPPNFTMIYETKAWRNGETAPFHRMRTLIQVRYDPEAELIRAARVESSESGHAFRHVCMTPAGPLLRLRIATLLDGRPEDLTVVNVHSENLSVRECADIGVGPQDGLVEGLDVVFRGDGSFRVVPGSGAHLAGAGIRVERTLTRGPGNTDPVTEKLP